MISIDLAIELDDGIYVRGSKDHMEWLHARQKNAELAGKKSAEARKAKYGTARPQKAPDSRTTHERRTNDVEPNATETEPSYYYSSSSSSSYEEESEDMAEEKILAPKKYQISTPEELQSVIPEKAKALWPKLYPDQDFVNSQALVALEWCETNPKKKPATKAGWSRFFSRWLRRSWKWQLEAKANNDSKNNKPGSGSFTGGWED